MKEPNFAEGKIFIRVHSQQDSSTIVSVHTPGRTIRVCGSPDYNRPTCIALMKDWITWIRRGSFST